MINYFNIDENIGIRTYNDNNIIQIEINKTKTQLTIYINESIISIDQNYIVKNISQNFNVEMLYHVLVEFVKYNNYKLICDSHSRYTIKGFYQEPYEQGDLIDIVIPV